MSSAIGREITGFLSTLKRDIHSHDRGVLVGLIFSSVPFLPITIIGIVINYWNYRLLNASKLPPNERNLIRYTFYIGPSMLIVGVIFLLIAYNTVTGIGLALPELFGSLWNFISLILIEVAELFGQLIEVITGGTDDLQQELII